MIDFLLICLRTSLEITAIHILCLPGNAGDGVRQWKIKEYLRKPLFDCLPCMASIWGLIFFLCFFHFDAMLLIHFCLIVCGINTIISTLIRISSGNEFN